MSEAVTPAKIQDLDTMLRLQFIGPAFKSIRLHKLLHFLVAVRKISRVQDAHLFYVIAHSAAVCQNSYVCSLQCLLDHILIASQRRGGINLYGNMTACFLLDRSMEDDLLCDVIRATGAEPVVMDYADLYSALQSGEVDGAENPVCSYYSNQFYKVAPYYTMDAHTHSPSVIIISELTWNHLSEEDRQILMTAADLAKEYNKTVIENAEKEAYAKLAEENVVIIEMGDMTEWQEAMEFIYQSHAGDHYELIEKIKEMAD